MDIKERLKTLPDAPGVYILKDSKGCPIYVGKASSLRRRVASHFKDRGVSLKQSIIISNTKDIEYILTGSEAEALLMEAALVKENQPRYNVELKDDKSFPRLKLTLNETWPRLLITRKKKPDGAIYFGPYTSSKLLRQAVKILRRLFPLRMCKDFPLPCTDYHIGQCWAPWLGEVNKDSYNRMVNELILFLQGRRAELLKQLFSQMEQASRERHFEDAARIRDQIQALTQVVTKKRDFTIKDELQELRAILNMDSMPNRIEAFDISDIHGLQAVGSMVSFLDGRPDKDNYRRFKIETVKSIDDYSMMREVINRRYSGLVKEGKPLPDLIIIDGGKGHLSTALDELKRLGLDVPSIGIAKQFEYVYLADRKDPVILPPNSKVLHLIQRIRDEAHRFAISYHHRLRKDIVTASELDAVPGIGKKLKRLLVTHFGSLDKIRQAKAETLSRVKYIGKKRAEMIKEYLY